MICGGVQTTYVALIIELGADVIELIEHMRFGDADRYEFANVGHDKVVDDLATHDDDLGFRLFQGGQCHLMACFFDLWTILLEVWAVKLVWVRPLGVLRSLASNRVQIKDQSSWLAPDLFADESCTWVCCA
jgi:hypothetical protein